MSDDHSESYTDSEGEERCSTCDKWLERDYYDIDYHHKEMTKTRWVDTATKVIIRVETDVGTVGYQFLVDWTTAMEQPRMWDYVCHVAGKAIIDSVRKARAGLS